jgi:hypothetical protein
VFDRYACAAEDHGCDQEKHRRRLALKSSRMHGAPSLTSDLNAFTAAGSVADPDLTPLPAGGDVNMPILEARAVASVIAQAVIVVVIVVVIEGDDDEALVEVVISFVIPVVDAAAHAGADKSAAGMSCGESTTNESSAGVSAGESATAESTTDASTARSTSESAATTRMSSG